MKGKHRKQRRNCIKIFTIMVLFFVCLGYIVTLRIEHGKENGTDGAHTASAHDNQRREILADESRYP